MPKPQFHLQQLNDDLAHFLSNPPWKPHLDNLITNLKTQASQIFQPLHNKTLNPRQPPWAHLSSSAAGGVGSHRFDLAMTTAEVEERLAGVPVYALSNSDEEFVLVSGVKTGKSLGLFCLREEDAESLLGRMMKVNLAMREGSRVVPIALSKVFQLKVDGVAFRLIPDPKQVANAIKEKGKSGVVIEEFPGVPVFQSRSLVLRSENKRFRPMFFRKEDLEDSLLRASREQMQLNPAFRKGDIQVCALEEIINEMKGSSASNWDDVVFIPPGFNVSVGVHGRRPTMDA